MYRGKTRQECIDRYSLMQKVTYDMFCCPQDNTYAIQRLNLENHWILFTYTRSPWADDETAVGILHRYHTNLFMENGELVTYINEGERTFRASVLKIINNYERIKIMLESIKHELMEDYQVISSQVLVKAQQDTPAPSLKILTGSSKNYIRVLKPGDNCIRPLMINTWAQTMTNDVSTLLQIEHRREPSKREIELLEEIHKLESDLRAHSEVLSQIHATSARTAALLGQPTPQPLQIQIVESQSSNPHTSSQAIPGQFSNQNSA